MLSDVESFVSFILPVLTDFACSGTFDVALLLAVWTEGTAPFIVGSLGTCSKPLLAPAKVLTG